MRDKLEPDETIETVLPDLTDPDGYVRRVFSLMHRDTVNRENLSVRIGVQGTGQKPYFRIVLNALECVPDSDDQIIGAYYDNGDPLKTSSGTNENWSTATTSYQGVRAILERWQQERNQHRANRRR